MLVIGFENINLEHVYEMICSVITVQLNLNLTEHTCSMGSTRHVFHFTHMQACMCMQDCLRQTYHA